MRILLADDHVLMRELLAQFIEAHFDARVVTAMSLAEAQSIMEMSEKFDLVLLEWRLPGMDGVASIEEIMRVSRNSPLAILSGSALQDTARMAIKAGAVGFLPKSMSVTSLIPALRLMIGGGVFLPYEWMQRSPTGVAADLTTRELEVLNGISHGHTNKKIARDFGLKEVTIKLHVKTMCRKLNAKNRAHAAAIASHLRLT